MAKHKKNWKPVEGGIVLVNKACGFIEHRTLLRERGEPLLEFLKACLAWRNLFVHGVGDIADIGESYVSIWTRGREIRFSDTAGMLACYRQAM